MYTLCTSPDNAAILKTILHTTSHLNNHPTIKFISYRIQEITNKDIYCTIIKKNAFILDSYIIPVYDIEERDVDKFKQLITKSICIQDIEQTHESKINGKYFLITTKMEHKKAIIEAREIVEYIYPQRSNIY